MPKLLWLGCLAFLIFLVEQYVKNMLCLKIYYKTTWMNKCIILADYI